MRIHFQCLLSWNLLKHLSLQQSAMIDSNLIPMGCGRMEEDHYFRIIVVQQDNKRVTYLVLKPAKLGENWPLPQDSV